MLSQDSDLITSWARVDSGLDFMREQSTAVVWTTAGRAVGLTEPHSKRKSTDLWHVLGRLRRGAKHSYPSSDGVKIALSSISALTCVFLA